MYNVHAFFNGSQYILVDLSFSFFMGLCSYSTLPVFFPTLLFSPYAQVKFIIERYKSVPNLIAMDILNKRVKGHSIASIFPVFLKDLPKLCMTV